VLGSADEVSWNGGPERGGPEPVLALPAHFSLDFYLALQQARIHISLFGKWKETYPTGGYASFLNIPSPYKYFNPCLEQQ
jgi:hypothetical protein